MAEQFEVRVILSKRPHGKVEISYWSPQQRREVKTGLVVGPDREVIDKNVMHLKNNLERNGYRVQVVEMA